MGNVYVTVTGADTKTGADWAHAMDLAAFETYYEGTPSDGDVIYFKAGEYTLTAAIDGSVSGDAAATAPITIIGVKAATSAEPPAYSDWAVVHGASPDCPSFVQGTNMITFGDYTKVFNCAFSGAVNGSLVTAGTYSVVYNCSFANSYNGTGKTALGVNVGSSIINCSAVTAYSGTPKGYGLSASTGTRILFSYVHDSVTGIMGASGGVYLFNFIDTCTTGINLVSTDYQTIMSNTFYGCTTAVGATDGFSHTCINNIIDTATDGFYWTTQEMINFFWNNHEGNSVTDMWDMDGAGANVTAPHDDKTATSGDPKITNAATGKCDLASDSPCIDAGMSLTVGVTTASRQNQGAWDAVTAAASGSSPRFGDMTGGLK